MVRGRKQTPDGRRNTWSVKLSDAEQDAAEAARLEAGVKRPEWLRSLISSAADAECFISPRAAAVIADLEDRLEQARSARSCCERCGTALACPSCHGGGDWA
jgi:hypothetical protein